MSTIEEWLRDHRISEVECLIPDMTGNARGKFIKAEKFNNEDPRLPESILLQTVTGEYCDEHDDLISPTDQDMVLAADPNTVRLVPWANEPTAQIIHDCYTSDGELHPMSSRNVLRRVLALYDEMGLKPIVAPEVEFYLIQKNEDPDFELQAPIGRSGRREAARQSYSIDAINEFEPIINTMYEFCEAQRLNIDTLIHESGAAQMEINFLHGDALELADQVFTFKRTMRETALRHGVYATFMAKPMRKEPGSSMHIHQSLVNKTTGENVFSIPTGEKTDIFMHYLGGLQKYTPDIFSFYAPNVNSYRRFAKDIAAPINLHWGNDNRTVGLRVPSAGPEATRIENRFAGVDANPYLAIAATLACGYAGIKNKIQPTEPYLGNAYEEEITLPRSLEEALRGLDDLSDLESIIGPDFIRAYRWIKLDEFEEFNRVISSWEREYLLLNV
ncbi:MAG: glutamine synthetase [Pseudomonadales bacterium]|nr:glutamine synthetase [Pseudomonadales bacterium]MCP5302930.1 glutamine synthetase [Pseudomonadales bacterium]